MRTRWKAAALAAPFVAGWLALFVGGGAAERVFARLFVGKNYADFSERGIWVVHPKGEAEQARREALKFDDFMSRLQKSYPEWQLERPRDLKVYLMTSHDDFKQFGEMETGARFEFNGGYFSPDKHQLVVIWSPNVAVSLRHEGTHALFHDQELPRWLNEGLATFFENTTDQWLGRIDAEYKALAGRALRYPEFSLKRVLEARAADFQAEDNAVFYAVANVMVAFFLDGSDPNLRQEFIKFVGDKASGASEEKVPGGVSPDDLKKRLLDFLGD